MVPATDLGPISPSPYVTDTVNWVPGAPPSRPTVQNAVALTTVDVLDGGGDIDLSRWPRRDRGDSDYSQRQLRAARGRHELASHRSSSDLVWFSREPPVDIAREMARDSDDATEVRTQTHRRLVRPS